MKTTVVVYKSKYGATEKYAQWIAADLDADVFESSQISASDLENYTVVIFGGGLYINKLNGLNFFHRFYRVLKDKKLLIFSCGMSDPGNERGAQRIKDAILKKIPQGMKDSVKIFHVRGGVTYAGMNFFDNFIMKMMERLVKSIAPPALSEEQKEIAAVLGNDFDFSKRETISPIVEYVKAG